MLRKHDLLRRVLYTATLLTVFALGQQITLPVFDPDAVGGLVNNNSVWQVIGLATGGQTRVPTLLTLGIGPYMTGMIAWSAIVTLDIGVINKMSPRVSGTIQKLVTFALASLQAILYVYNMRSALRPVMMFGVDMAFAIGVLLIATGGMFALQMGELNSRHGLGNLVVLILPGMIMGMSNLLRNGWGLAPLKITPAIAVAGVLVVLLFIPLITTLFSAHLRLRIIYPMLDSEYAKDSYMSLPLMTSGAMPFMFSSMIFSIPRALVTQLGATQSTVGKIVLLLTDYRAWPGVVSYGVLLVMMAFLFGMMQFQPTRRVRQLKEGSDYFPGVMPGDDTEKIILKHFRRLTAASLTIFALIGCTPLVIGLFWIPGLANFSPMLSNEVIIVTICMMIGEQFLALWNKERYQMFDNL